MNVYRGCQMCNVLENLKMSKPIANIIKLHTLTYQSIDG